MGDMGVLDKASIMFIKSTVDGQCGLNFVRQLLVSQALTSIMGVVAAFVTQAGGGLVLALHA
jgi:hypothetical protein